jgi:hypothetical protein
MRQGGPSSGRRPRGRHHGGGHGGGGHGGGGGGGHHNNGNGNGNSGGPPRDNRPRTAASLRHQTFDSNCIDVRVRGNAWQVHEKYQALARHATGSGDRVAAENYLQHAEHYYRIIEAINEATAAEQRTRGGPPTPAFGQQPEVPVNYYGTDGNQQPAPPPGAPGTEGNVAGQPPAPQAQAEVQKRTPASPFFTPEEIEEQQQQGGNESLTARR